MLKKMTCETEILTCSRIWNAFYDFVTLAVN